MWLFTKRGFYSIISKGEDEWHVRARAEKDLEALNEVAGTDYKIHRSEDADYRWRMVIPGAEAKKLIAALAEDIDYSNFKGVIAKTPAQRDKLDILHRIWAEMYAYQEERE